MSKEHLDMGRLLNREKQLESTALITSGGHTFKVHRRFLMHDDDPRIEEYVVDTLASEGELSILRLGTKMDGPWGVEYYAASGWPISTDRAMWWVHALHATTRLAEEMNQREAAADSKALTTARELRII